MLSPLNAHRTTPLFEAVDNRLACLVVGLVEGGPHPGESRRTIRVKGLLGTVNGHSP